MKVLYGCFRNSVKWIMSGFVLLTALTAEAQKEVQFSQFTFHQLYFNPATAGKDNLTRVGVTYRSQYAGYRPTYFDKGGGPASQIITASLPLGKFGVGVYVLNDKIGALSQQDLQISVAYKLTLSNGNLSIGARGGLYRQTMDYGQLRTEMPDDPLILTGKVSEMQPDFSVGAHYESDVFYLGASAAHLTKPGFKLGSETATNPLSSVYYLNAGAYLSAGYMLEVQPVVLAKMVPGAFSAEGGALVTYDQRFFGGLTYRYQDAIAIVHAGAYLFSDQAFRLSGAYDVVARGNKAKTPTSFEVMLSYAFGRQGGGQKSIIRTPRFRF